MLISSLRICGFRCFGAKLVDIQLADLTTFVGPNSSGKTAAMLALVRMFGETSALRQIVPSDFHLQPEESLSDKSSRKLYIECKLDFPELNDDSTNPGPAVPESFNQMIVDAPGATPYCRIRLEAIWTDDGTALGETEQKLEWILTDADEAEPLVEEKRRKVLAADRAKIRILYVPASRDPEQQIRGTSSGVLNRLIKSLSWKDSKKNLEQKLVEIQQQIDALPGVQTLNTHVQNAWNNLYQGRIAGSMSFQSVDTEPLNLLRQINAKFAPGNDGRPISVLDLSDGLRSLFSLSLSLGLYEVERAISENPVETGFDLKDGSGLPLVTVFAIEEPENHLSPHYLGQVVRNLVQISSQRGAQVMLSSHSASILSRVEPDCVRYFRGNECSTETVVISLPLPQDKTDEAFKFVREAVRGYPELYFSSLVILGEGPSEEIVLKRIFEASGNPLDASFVSVVPLGGRHVNHFWRLLHALEIPYLTLLDLDREKEGAGWGRIQYVRDQLVHLYGKSSAQLNCVDAAGTSYSLSDPQFDSLADKDNRGAEEMQFWIGLFERQFSVYFSQPLDLDLCLLEAFTEEYKNLILPPDRGPKLPDAADPNFDEAIDKRVKQVLAADIAKAPPTLGSTYTVAQRQLFPWYKYLFVDGSKPVTHMRAMLAIKDHDLLEKLPIHLSSMLTHAKRLAN